jgi:hypothetical protein
MLVQKEGHDLVLWEGIDQLVAHLRQIVARGQETGALVGVVKWVALAGVDPHPHPFAKVAMLLRGIRARSRHSSRP